MIPVFKKHRSHMLKLKAMREGQVPAKEEMSTCPSCARDVAGKLLFQNKCVCPYCGYHHSVGAYFRMSLILDAGSFKEVGEAIVATNPLDFPGYDEKVGNLQVKTGITEAIVTATGRIDNRNVAIAVLDSRFLMGSMGIAVGEKLTRLIELASQNRYPLIIFSASGGARMQEGIFSLMQMAKTSGALAKYGDKGLPYISVLTNPTTGGVTASFASLGDIMLAEPGALIGFAGPRVIEQTIGQKLPEGFQRSEFLEEHGFIDQVVPRKELRRTLSRLLSLHTKGGVK